MEAIWLNDWSETKLEGLIEDFGIKNEDVKDMDFLLASYTYVNYSGDAFVLFQKDGALYEVNGSHCSCYGLSESSYSGSTRSQWEPEPTSLEALHHRATRGCFGGNEFKSELQKVLSRLMEKDHGE